MKFKGYTLRFKRDDVVTGSGVKKVWFARLVDEQDLALRGLEGEGATKDAAILKLGIAIGHADQESESKEDVQTETETEQEEGE